MRVTALHIQDVLRLEVVDITPDAFLQIIAGDNSQGKTSVLDALWLALGGRVASKGIVKPIRDGQDTALVRVEIDDFIITRSWEGSESTLVVTSKDGKKFAGPQSILDGLVGRLSFDPLAFMRLRPVEQAAELLGIVKVDIDLGALATKRQQVYEMRTEIGRKSDNFKGVVETLGPIEKDLPAAEVPVTVHIAMYQTAQTIHLQEQTIRLAGISLANRVKALTEELTAAEEALVKSRAEYQLINLPLPDLEAMKLQITNAEDTNIKVRKNVERQTAYANMVKTGEEYDEASKTIAAIDKQKADALAAAAFPVDGLGVNDNGVTYNGIPLSQASSSEQIEISLGIAMALNPELRIIRIDDGSLLDENSMNRIKQTAQNRDYQVWVERVGTNDSSSVVIKDGKVLQAKQEAI